MSEARRLLPEQMAQAFHEAYEELAPQFGYKTREASAVPWADVPENNKALMIATCERVARAYLAQPITKCEDLAAAICFLEHSKNTHENWAAWLADDKVASPDAGDLEHHRRCILEYEHILDVIQGTAREGELVAQAEAAERLRRGIQSLRTDHQRVHPCTLCDERLAALAPDSGEPE